MNDDELINQVYRKIEREKVLINAANAMRQNSNPQVQASLDSQVREARKGIEYLEERMRELQMRRLEGQGARSNGGPPPPLHGHRGPSGQRGGNSSQQGGPPLPPKDLQGRDQQDYDDPQMGSYTGMNDMSGGHGMMPPRAPFGPPAPESSMPKSRPNYTKLGQTSYLESNEIY